jgi:hypothetical protein
MEGVCGSVSVYGVCVLVLLSSLLYVLCMCVCTMCTRVCVRTSKVHKDT